MSSKQVRIARVRTDNQASIEGLFTSPDAKGKKRAIEAMRKARYADRIARLKEPVAV